VKQAATHVEGSGGGRKDLAEAGGKNPPCSTKPFKPCPES